MKIILEYYKEFKLNDSDSSSLIEIFSLRVNHLFCNGLDSKGATENLEPHCEHYYWELQQLSLSAFRNGCTNSVSGIWFLAPNFWHLGNTERAGFKSLNIAGAVPELQNTSHFQILWKMRAMIIKMTHPQS